MSKDSLAKYYQDSKERVPKMWKISKSFQRRKEKKQQFGREQYKNLSEDQKHKLVEYRKKYKIWKNKNASQRLDVF